ncbi:hypothetical protein [Paenibacillus sp. Soil522]|uniref:hypothetical protein n=1 Tax=Paenibacillus sp. Soil522 TaxID=1736388 RepID=UPI0006F72467|nr:hypothetical protein [Paenibacillus sp. Soil522]KRE33941.1 hypothetical protein ASG81_23130 [Paenibacillus sp. Soil522]
MGIQKCRARVTILGFTVLKINDVSPEGPPDTYTVQTRVNNNPITEIGPINVNPSSIGVVLNPTKLVVFSRIFLKQKKIRLKIETKVTEFDSFSFNDVAEAETELFIPCDCCESLVVDYNPRVMGGGNDVRVFYKIELEDL